MSNGTLGILLSRFGNQMFKSTGVFGAALGVFTDCLCTVDTFLNFMR